MASKIKVDQIQTADGSGTIALQNQLSGMTSASMPTGSVIQTVSATYSTEVQTTSQSHSDTGLTATITPTSSSNKVLVIVNQNGLEKDNSDIRMEIKLLRGSTDVLIFAGDQTCNTSTNNRTDIGGAGGTILDTPSTTSATVYKTQFKNGGSGTAYLNNSPSTGQVKFSLMEVSA